MVTIKNILELLLEWDMWPICVYKEVYIFLKNRFFTYRRKGFNGYIILWIRSETKSTPKLNKLIFIARRLRHSESNKYFAFFCSSCFDAQVIKNFVNPNTATKQKFKLKVKSVTRRSDRYGCVTCFWWKHPF